MIRKRSTYTPHNRPPEQEWLFMYRCGLRADKTDPTYADWKIKQQEYKNAKR